MKSRGIQHGHPGAHQRSILLCTAKKARVFDGYLLTWPQHHISPRARGFWSWEAERKRVAVRRGHTWELGHSSEGLFFQIMGFSQVPQSCFVLACIWSAAHNHSLSSFSVPPGRHFRSFWQSVQFCKHLNQRLPQLGTVGDFTSRLGGLNSRKPGMPSTICGVSYEEPKRPEGKLLTNRLGKPSSEPCLDGAMKDTKIK